MVRFGAAWRPSFLGLLASRAAYESREIPQDTKRMTKVLSQSSQTKSITINGQFFPNRDFGRPYSIFTVFLPSGEDPGPIRTLKKTCGNANVNGSMHKNVTTSKTHSKVYNQTNKRAGGGHPRSSLGYGARGGVGKILVMV